MQAPSHVLASLIEPALLALSKPSEARLQRMLEKAQELRRTVRTAFKESGRNVDAPSFDFGVATAFVELLATAKQRSVLGDSLRELTGVPLGIETLHLIGFLSHSGIEATQGDLADVLKIDRGNFSRRIRQFEELALVDSSKKGRKLSYELTALGFDVLSELRPGWRAIHPMSHEKLISEAAAATAATSIVASIQRVIAGEQSEGRLMDELFTRVIEMGGRSTDLLGVAKSQSRTPFGGPLPDKTPRVSFEVRAA